uniref:4-nitrophenylphosphatase n=1 Tax=Percolomonas cosmopolitus TaxID=63605 RepID=A0A7S1PJ84_9EUKA
MSHTTNSKAPKTGITCDTAEESTCSSLTSPLNKTIQMNKAHERHDSTHKASKMRLALKDMLFHHDGDSRVSVEELHEREPSVVPKRGEAAKSATEEYVPSTETLDKIRSKKAFILDADGTLYVTTMNGGNRLLEGTKLFFEWATKNDKEILILTNSSKSTDVALQAKFKRLLGFELPLEHFITSAESTALFLSKQSPGAKCFVLGEEGLFYYLKKYGLHVLNPREGQQEDPSEAEYVVMGESRAYRYEDLALAINLVNTGSRFLATNTDVVDIDENGNLDPSTGSFTSIIEAATGISPYCCGKPSVLIMQFALEKLKSSKEDTVMIGDRMDTDILASTEANLDNVLVLSGVSEYSKLHRFPYKPRFILRSLNDLVKDVQ